MSTCIKYINIFFFFYIVLIQVAFSNECEDISFSPTYNELITNTFNVLNQINNANCQIPDSLLSTRMCEPNNLGTCYANASTEVYSSLTQSVHPLYAALLYKKAYESDNKDASVVGGSSCQTVKLLTKEKEICDYEKFNMKFSLGKDDAFDELLTQIKIPEDGKLTRFSVMKSIIKGLLFLNTINQNDELIYKFNKALEGKSVNNNYDRSQMSEFVKGLQPGAYSQMFEVLWEKNNWDEFAKIIDQVISQRGKFLNNIDLQFIFMQFMCKKSNSLIKNPLYLIDIDYKYNTIGDQKYESEVIHKFFEAKKMIPLGKRYPDYISIYLDRFLDPKSTSMEGHAFIALGQKWDPIYKRCQLVLKDSNPHYEKKTCRSAPSRNLLAVYDENTFSCYYYFPKYDLINNDNNYIYDYCFVAPSKIISKVN